MQSLFPTKKLAKFPGLCWEKNFSRSSQRYRPASTCNTTYLVIHHHHMMTNMYVLCKNKTHKKIIHKYNCVETTIKAEERRRGRRRGDNHGGIITFYEIVNNHLHQSSVSLWVRMSRRMMKMSFMCNMSLTIACRCSLLACRSTSMIP